MSGNLSFDEGDLGLPDFGPDDENFDLVETEAEAMEIWPDENRDEEFWNNMELEECERRMQRVTAHIMNRAKFLETAKLLRKRKMFEGLAAAKTRAARGAIRSAGILEGDEMEYTRALLEVVDEDGLVRNVESKEKIGEKMLSSAIFRRLGTEEMKSRVLSGQSLQLKSEQMKAELERKCEEGLKFIVLFGAEKRAPENQSHYLRLPQLMELPAVVLEAKWAIFVGIKPWQGTDFGLRDFIHGGKGGMTFELLNIALDNATWLAMGVFGEAVTNLFATMKELARQPQVMNVLNVEFVEWVFAALWKELWGILRSTYRVNDEVVVLQNGGWIPLWDKMVEGIVLSEQAQTRWSVHVRKISSGTVQGSESGIARRQSRAKAEEEEVSSGQGGIQWNKVTMKNADQVCLVELAHGLRCVIGGRPQPACTTAGCRYNHNWKAMGKTKALQSVTNGRAQWLSRGNNRAALLKAVNIAQF